MNLVKNKNGSTILWTILFTNILIVLLGSLLTLSYSYHKATIETVKKQQAYFTARSATDAVISELTTNGYESKLMPFKEGAKIELDNIQFEQGSKMGSATANIVKTTEQQVDIEVNARYADNTYKMTATVMNQPLYFGGIAVKKLNLNNNTFTLSDNTDLYYDPEDKSTLNGKIDIGGNLIAKGDIHLLSGSRVAGINFNKDIYLDNNQATNHPSKMIWDAKHYIISNYSVEAKYPSFVQTKPMMIKSILKGNYNRVKCNNVYNDIFEFDDNFFDNLEVNKGSLDNDVRYIKITNRDIHGELYADKMQRTGKIPSKFYPTSIKQADGTYFTNWNYNKRKTGHNLARMAKHAYDFSLGDHWNQYVRLDYNTYSAPNDEDAPGYNRYYVKNCFDAKQIDYSASGNENYNDKVSNVVYVLVENNCAIRLQYGLDKQNGKIISKIEDFLDKLKNEKFSYLVIYLGENSTLELGKNAASDQLYRLQFFMSVYGLKGSKVVLNDNVNFHGSIYVDDLELKGNASVDYMAQNGGKVAKQQVDELWTISNYSD